MEKTKGEIIGSLRQIEWAFSVSHIAVFGNALRDRSHRVNRWWLQVFLPKK